jgi:hypothetical protein
MDESAHIIFGGHHHGVILCAGIAHTALRLVWTFLRSLVVVFVYSGNNPGYQQWWCDGYHEQIDTPM